MCFNTESIVQENNTQSIGFRISLRSNKVKDSTGLLLKISIKNVSDTSMVVYKHLAEGYQSDRRTNFNLVFEKKGKQEFKTYNMRSFYNRIPLIKDTPDLIENVVDEIEKVVLKPGDSIFHSFHMDHVYKFEKGKYRVKSIYRNNILTNNKIYSNWVYFDVTNTIYVTKYDQ